MVGIELEALQSEDCHHSQQATGPDNFYVLAIRMKCPRAQCCKLVTIKLVSGDFLSVLTYGGGRGSKNDISARTDKGSCGLASTVDSWKCTPMARKMWTVSRPEKKDEVPWRQLNEFHALMSVQIRFFDNFSSFNLILTIDKRPL